MKVSVKKIDNALYPIGEHSQDEMQHMINGNEYVIDVKMHRNPKFHRFAFALLNMIYHNQENFDNFDLFRSWITMKAGYIITGTAPNGSPLFLPESLSFASMPQEKFERWFSKVVDVAIAEYGMNENTLNQILNFA